MMIGLNQSPNWLKVEEWMPLHVAVEDARMDYVRQYGELPDVLQVDDRIRADIVGRVDFIPVLDPKFFGYIEGLGIYVSHFYRK